MRAYRESIITASELNPLDLFYYRFRPEDALERIAQHGGKHRQWKKGVLAKAARKNSMRALTELTAVVDGHRVIVPDPPRIARIDEELAERNWAEISQFFQSYKETLPLDRRLLIDQFSLVDVARKVVGVGASARDASWCFSSWTMERRCFSNSSKRPNPYSNNTLAAAYLSSPVNVLWRGND